MAGLSEERPTRRKLDPVVEVGEDQPDEHVNAQAARDGLAGDAFMVQDAPADGERTRQHEDRGEQDLEAVGLVTPPERHSEGDEESDGDSDQRDALARSRDA